MQCEIKENLIRMCRLAASLLAEKATWVVQKRCDGQVQYFQIEDPFEAQRMLRDALKFIMHGYAPNFETDFDPRLDANAAPWDTDNNKWSKFNEVYERDKLQQDTKSGDNEINKIATQQPHEVKDKWVKVKKKNAHPKKTHHIKRRHKVQRIDSRS